MRAQHPGAGGGLPAQLNKGRGHALTWRGLNPPELQLELSRLRRWATGILPPLPADDPVLEDRADGVEPAPPYKPGRAAVVSGLDVHRFAVHPAAVRPAHDALPARAARRPATWIETMFTRTSMQIFLSNCAWNAHKCRWRSA